MERKFIITSIFITFGAIAFLGGYLLIPELLYWSDQYSRESSDNQMGSLIEKFNNNIKAETAENKIPKILPFSTRRFLSFVNPYSNSKKIVAVEKNGNIVEIDVDDLGETIIATLKHNNASEMFLSPDGNSAVYSFYDPNNNKRFFYFNFSAGSKPVEINNDLRSVAFSPRGDQAAYFINNGNEGELLISKEGIIIRKTLKTRLNNAEIGWPSDFLSLISYDKNGYSDLFVLKEGNALNKTILHQRGLSVKWSPSAEKLIFSSKDETNSDRLFYKDFKNDGTVVALDINANASKCIWTNGEVSVICGVTNQSSFRDEFYRISIPDGSVSVTAIPNINLIAREMAISRSEDYLFVLNDIDSMLYALKIK